MAEAMGINTFRYKVVVFVLAALLASVAGWLLAHFQRTVNPSPFGLKMGIEYLFMAVIGGVGYVWGALAGAALVKVMEDQLQVWLPRIFGGSGNYELIVFGLLLVLVLKYARDGVWAFIDERLPRAQRRGDDWRDAPPLPEAAKPAHAETVLEVKAARKEFGGLVAVNDVSFEVAAGEIVGLIGPNGAGKSTTFNLITGLLELTRGEVRFRGASVAGKPSREIARLGVGRTFQHVRMIPTMTVLENVALGPQRLMEIARALATDPALLLLDEPAAGLRLKEKRSLAEVLRQLKREGMSILLVEHDMDLVMGLVDRVVVMEFGTKLIEGTPVEVQASPAVRAAYLGTEH